MSAANSSGTGLLTSGTLSGASAGAASAAGAARNSEPIARFIVVKHAAGLAIWKGKYTRVMEVTPSSFITRNPENFEVTNSYTFAEELCDCVPAKDNTGTPPSLAKKLGCEGMFIVSVMKNGKRSKKYSFSSYDRDRILSYMLERKHRAGGVHLGRGGSSSSSSSDIEPGGLHCRKFTRLGDRRPVLLRLGLNALEQYDPSAPTVVRSRYLYWRIQGVAKLDRASVMPQSLLSALSSAAAPSLLSSSSSSSASIQSGSTTNNSSAGPLDGFIVFHGGPRRAHMFLCTASEADRFLEQLRATCATRLGYQIPVNKPIPLQVIFDRRLGITGWPTNASLTTSGIATLNSASPSAASSTSISTTALGDVQESVSVLCMLASLESPGSPDTDWVAVPAVAEFSVQKVSPLRHADNPPRRILYVTERHLLERDPDAYNAAVSGRWLTDIFAIIRYADDPLRVGIEYRADEHRVDYMSSSRDALVVALLDQCRWAGNQDVDVRRHPVDRAVRCCPLDRLVGYNEPYLVDWALHQVVEAAGVLSVSPGQLSGASAALSSATSTASSAISASSTGAGGNTGPMTLALAGPTNSSGSQALVLSGAGSSTTSSIHSSSVSDGFSASDGVGPGGWGGTGPTALDGNKQTAIFNRLRNFNANVSYSGRGLFRVDDHGRIKSILAAVEASIVLAGSILPEPDVRMSAAAAAAAAASGAGSSSGGTKAKPTLIVALLHTIRRLLSCKVGFESFVAQLSNYGPSGSSASSAAYASTSSSSSSSSSSSLSGGGSGGGGGQSAGGRVPGSTQFALARAAESFFPRLWRSVRSTNEDVAAAAADVLGGFVQPSFDDYDARQVVDMKAAIYSHQNAIKGALDQLNQHARVGTGALVVSNILDLMAFAICDPYAQNTDAGQFNMLVNMMAEMGSGLFRLFQHPCFCVSRLAGMLMQSIIEESMPDVAKRMQDAALREGAVLRHLFYGIFTPAVDRRQILSRNLSRHLVALWTMDHDLALDVLRRVVPAALLEFLREDREAPVDARESAILQAGSGTSVGADGDALDLEGRKQSGVSTSRRRGVLGVQLLDSWRKQRLLRDQQRRLASIQSSVASGSGATTVAAQRARSNQLQQQQQQQRRSGVLDPPNNWPWLFYQVQQDFARPDLIWNHQTREELRLALDTEIRLFTNEQELHRSEPISWNHVEFEVLYPSLHKELKIGGCYIRLLLDEQSKPALSQPVLFFAELYHALLREPARDMKLLCLQSLAIIYRWYWEQIGPFLETPYILAMLRDTRDRAMRDRLLIFLDRLLENRVNAKLFIDHHGIAVLVDLLTLSHLQTEVSYTPLQSDLIEAAPNQVATGEREWYYAPDEIDVAPLAPISTCIDSDAVNVDGIVSDDDATSTASTSSTKKSSSTTDDSSSGNVRVGAAQPRGRREGPVTLDEMRELFRTGQVKLRTRCWAQGMDSWMPLESVPPLRWELVATQSPVLSYHQLGARVLDMLVRLCSLYPSRDSDGALIRPLPRAKTFLSQPSVLPYIVQTLLTFDARLVDSTAELLIQIVQDNPVCLSRLFLTGLFFFVCMYPGSNILRLVRLLQLTHTQQAFRDDDFQRGTKDRQSSSAQQQQSGGVDPFARSSGGARSVLSPLLPEAMICLLENYGVDRFAEVFLGEFNTPEVIWNHGMRRLLIEKIAFHLGTFSLRLKSNPRAVHAYCPFPPIEYPELEDEMFCHIFYLRNLCDTARFPEWLIRDPIAFLQSCLMTWKRELSFRPPPLSETEAFRILELDPTQRASYRENDIRRAYFKLAQRYHPDKNPDETARHKFEQVHIAYKLLAAAFRKSGRSQTPVERIHLLLKSQCILFERYREVVAPFKYAGFPMLCHTMRLRAFDVQKGQFDDNSIQDQQQQQQQQQQQSTSAKTESKTESNSSSDPNSATITVHLDFSEHAAVFESAARLFYLTIHATAGNAHEFCTTRHAMGIVVALFARVVPILDSEPVTSPHRRTALHILSACVDIAGSHEGISRLLESTSGTLIPDLTRCLFVREAPQLVEAALLAGISMCTDAMLQQRLYDAGFLWHLLPFLFRYDYTLDEGGVEKSAETNRQELNNRLAKVAVRALVALGGYGGSTPALSEVQAAIRAVLPPYFVGMLTANRPSRLLHELNVNHENPLVIWNNGLRRELLDFVDGLLAELRRTAEWPRSAVARFAYADLKDELVVDGIYVRVYDDDKHASFQPEDPRRFARALLAYLQREGDRQTQRARRVLNATRMAQQQHEEKLQQSARFGGSSAGGSSAIDDDDDVVSSSGSSARSGSLLNADSNDRLGHNRDLGDIGAEGYDPSGADPVMGAGGGVMSEDKYRQRVELVIGALRRLLLTCSGAGLDLEFNASTPLAGTSTPSATRKGSVAKIGGGGSTTPTPTSASSSSSSSSSLSSSSTITGMGIHWFRIFSFLLPVYNQPRQDYKLVFDTLVVLLLLAQSRDCVQAIADLDPLLSVLLPMLFVARRIDAKRLHASLLAQAASLGTSEHTTLRGGGGGGAAASTGSSAASTGNAMAAAATAMANTPGFAALSEVGPDWAVLEMVISVLHQHAGNTNLVVAMHRFGAIPYLLLVAIDGDCDLRVRSFALGTLAKMIGDKVHGSRLAMMLSKFLPTAFVEVMKESPVNAIKMLDNDHENPELIWNDKTRAELGAAVSAAAQGFFERQRDLLSGDPRIPFEHPEEHIRRVAAVQYDLPKDYVVVFSDLREEPSAGGVYVRLFVKQPQWALRQPRLFLVALLEKYMEIVQRLVSISTSLALSMAATAAGTLSAFVEGSGQQQPGGTGHTDPDAERSELGVQSDLLDLYVRCLVGLLQVQTGLADHVAATGYIAKLFDTLNQRRSSLVDRPNLIVPPESMNAHFVFLRCTLSILRQIAESATCVSYFAKLDCVRPVCDLLRLHPNTSLITPLAVWVLERVYVNADQISLSPLVAQGMRGGLVELLLSYVDVRTSPYTGEDQPAMKARVINVIKMMLTCLEYRPMLSATLDQSPAWAPYKDLSYDLFIGTTNQDHLLITGSTIDQRTQPVAGLITSGRETGSRRDLPSEPPPL